jgi:hypothetical protein
MGALRQLHVDAKAVVMPVLDLVAPSTESQKQNPVAFVTRNVETLGNNLDGFVSVFLDSSEIDAALRLSGNRHPLVVAFEKIAAKGVSVVPVSALSRDRAHWQASLHIAAKQDLNKICLRLDPYDLEVPSDTAESVAQLKKRELATIEVVLLYDLRGIHGKDPLSLASQVSTLDQKLLPHVASEAIVAGCGLPEKMSEVVSARSASYIRRAELDVWDQLRSASARGIKFLLGDYTTVTPDYVELDWKLIHKMIGPKIIYALKEEWFVTRGGSFEKSGRDQYYDLAREVVKLADYPDPRYSFGDEYVYDRANETEGPGSPGSWIAPCVNRHITLTAREISGKYRNY